MVMVEERRIVSDSVSELLKSYDFIRGSSFEWVYDSKDFKRNIIQFGSDLGKMDWKEIMNSADSDTLDYIGKMRRTLRIRRERDLGKVGFAHNDQKAVENYFNKLDRFLGQREDNILYANPTLALDDAIDHLSGNTKARLNGGKTSYEAALAAAENVFNKMDVSSIGIDEINDKQLMRVRGKITRIESLLGGIGENNGGETYTRLNKMIEDKLGKFRGTRPLSPIEDEYNTMGSYHRSLDKGIVNPRKIEVVERTNVRKEGQEEKRWFSAAVGFFDRVSGGRVIGVYNALVNGGNGTGNVVA